MEERQGLEDSVLDPSAEHSRSDSKVSGGKRGSVDSGGESEERVLSKKTKMRDLDSVFPSQALEIHSSESLECESVRNQLHFGESQDGSEMTKVPEAMVSAGFQRETTEQTTLFLPQNASHVSPYQTDSHHCPMDLNTKAHPANDMACDIDENGKASLKNDKDHGPSFVSSRGIGFDLNADGTSKTASQNPFNSFKPHGYVKSTEASECGSSTGPLEENDSYRKWKEMKRNGFLSSSAHGGIPMPSQPSQQRPKKRRNDSLKKKMEIAKREQVHRFTKIAAPSGLLNGLNPGIINHVRNSKQVHSIIEALVRSEKRESSVQSRSAGHLKVVSDTNEKERNPESIHDSGASLPSVYLKAEPTNDSFGNMQTNDYPVSSSIVNMSSSITEHKGRSGNPEVAERRFHDETSGVSHLTSDYDDEMLALKLSPSLTLASESEELTNHPSVSSLSARAATVASQWLELLYQDIRGRISALRRSKKRVQAVIQTELPFLILKEFPSTQENDPSVSQYSSSRCSNTAVSDMHRARWTALFNQMDKTLAEEGKHLENWLSQVKEMQLQCERGLQGVNWHSLQSLGGRSESNPRSKMEIIEKDLALRAAAASIYSTCNFVKATEDVSCF